MPSLRAALLADSVACFIYGSVLTIAADSLSPLLSDQAFFPLGYPLEEFLQVLGFGVLAAGAGVWAVGRSPRISPIAVWLIVGIEAIWIIGSLFFGWTEAALSGVGVAFFMLNAIAVFCFMVVELMGLRRYTSEIQSVIR